MQKQIVVAGCRNYNDYDSAREYIEMCIKDISAKKQRDSFAVLFLLQNPFCCVKIIP